MRIRLANRFELLLSTVPRAYPMQPFVDLLTLDATLVNVGAMEDLQSVSGRSLIFGRKSIAGSVVGGIAETQELIDYCTARNIKADIELIRPDQINQAYERVVNKDVRYRFVIDMASMKSWRGRENATVHLIPRLYASPGIPAHKHSSGENHAIHRHACLACSPRVSRRYGRSCTGCRREQTIANDLAGRFAGFHHRASRIFYRPCPYRPAVSCQ